MHKYFIPGLIAVLFIFLVYRNVKPDRDYDHFKPAWVPDHYEHS